MQAILLYWFAAQYTSAQQQTSTLRLHLDGRKLASVTWNLVQSLMDLVFSSKNNRKWSKNG